jgi:hypothetical protein
LVFNIQESATIWQEKLAVKNSLEGKIAMESHKFNDNDDRTSLMEMVDF